MSMLNIVLFGPPGSGKGTQAEFLVKRHGLIHLSTGEILRQEIAANTELGKQAKVFMDKGELVSDHLVIEMIEVYLAERMDAHGFIFDGFPRTVDQAKALDVMLSEHDSPITAMISLEVEQKELMSRLLNRGRMVGRVDDQNQRVIENRIEVYKQKTLPLIEYYRPQGKYFPIDGIGSIEEISESIEKVIAEL